MSYNENYMHYTGTWLANEPNSYAAQQKKSHLVMAQQPKIYRDLLLCAHAGEKSCELPWRGRSVCEKGRIRRCNGLLTDWEADPTCSCTRMARSFDLC